MSSYYRAVTVLLLLAVMAELGLTIILPDHTQYFYPPGPSKCHNVWWKGLAALSIKSQTGVTYGEKYNCDIHIYTNGWFHSDEFTTRVRITFHHFEMERTLNGVCVDYLQIFLDDAMTKPLTPPLCGTTIPPTLELDQGNFVLYLRTDGINDRPGFIIHYNETLTRIRGGGNGGSGGTNGFGSGGDGTGRISTASSLRSGWMHLLLCAFLAKTFMKRLLTRNIT